MFKMSLNNAQQEILVGFLLIATVFFIPISASLKSIFIILSAIALLFSPTYRQALPFVFSKPWCKAALILFMIVLIGCFWSDAPYRARFIFIDKYSKLLYLPIFAIGFRNHKIRKMAIYAFFLAMLLTFFMACFKNYNQSATFDKLFHDHIATSYMMAFAAYLSGLMAYRSKGIKRLLLILQTILFSYQVIFMNFGRMGYILYGALMILLLIQVLPWKHLATGILCFCALFAFTAYHSSTVSVGLRNIANDINEYQQGKIDTSVGMRLVFHTAAKQLFLSSPWIGHGTGSFSSFNQTHNPIAAYMNIMEPHSQYWLIAAEYGVLGLVALLYFLISLWVAAFQLGEMRPVMIGMLVCFLISNLSESQLLHSNVGYLFIVFCALCLGEMVENKGRASLKKRSLNQPNELTLSAAI